MKPWKADDLFPYRLSLGTAPRRCCPDSCPGRCTRSCGQHSYRFDTWSDFPSTTVDCLSRKDQDKGNVNNVKQHERHGDHLSTFGLCVLVPDARQQNVKHKQTHLLRDMVKNKDFVRHDIWHL